MQGSVPDAVTVLIEDACYCLGPAIEAGETYVIVAEHNGTRIPADLVARNGCWGSGAESGYLPDRLVRRLRGDQ